ncbi:putative ELP-3 histone acetyl transferase [Aureococcus anophagefferens virus]|uniref:tRNA carboxymethyluridine synthase n=1 Tax=Aureococcus anophagefferens virus TaxID=1474867 RepID=A0A076FG07_9VIRU|nr:putative ELP-3 histone acetyl transferase [Aureococcus anophagefferens virus]AII17209.1 putative ELP-3 histone acetyl transferase [Aureococcus anophagefferens virus]UOG94279.1 iron-sulfur cluster binding [Aureococcus anophagefferens virus]
MDCYSNSSQIEIENLCDEKLHNTAYDSIENQKIIDEFLIDNLNQRNWQKLSKKIKAFSKIHKITVRKTDLVASFHKQGLNEPDFYQIIMKRAMRSQSGVLVCTVFTDAFPKYYDQEKDKIVTQKFSCKHDCFFCPSEPAREENNFIAQPRSYLSTEPGVARATSVNYDVVAQINFRLMQYQKMGHELDKLEVLVLGGTWSEYPLPYQKEFIRNIYFAANAFYSKREDRFSLEEEMLLNETAKIRIIGLTLETRPDTITLEEIKRFRSYGCTRLQMGAQHTNNDILKLSNRGHTVEHTKNAIRLLKKNGYKLDLHVMPNLHGSNPEIDKKMLDEILYDENLQADQLKLYPVSVVRWSMYEKMFKEGIYKPYSDDLLKDVLLYVKRKMHPWIRLNRVIRDIPEKEILGACSNPNMRQDLAKIANCKCIRCREVKGNKIDANYKIFRRDYKASGGQEVFLSFESNDKSTIYAFLRLRLQKTEENDDEVFDELKNTALIRELHVYGAVSKVGNKNSNSQHLGFGSKLLKEAEKISIQNGFKHIAVISGIGVREYYRKRGYIETTRNGFLKKNINSKTRRYLILVYITFLIHTIIMFLKWLK